MEITFSTQVAMDVGVNGAIVYQFISNLVAMAEIRKEGFYAGSYWIKLPLRTIETELPFMGRTSINSAVSRLIDKGYIKKTLEINAHRLERTGWYTTGDRYVNL